MSRKQLVFLVVISIDYTIKLSRANIKNFYLPKSQDGITKVTKTYHMGPMKPKTQKCISIQHDPKSC
jgi:hypothetical protein